MVDMTPTIQAKSDQANAIDFISGPQTITITEVRAGSKEQPISIFYEGCDNRPFKPSKTVRRVLVKLWGSDGSKYVGRNLTLYNDPDVMWAGEKSGGIRVSHASHIGKVHEMKLPAGRGKKKITIIVNPLTTPNTSTAPNEDERREARKTAVEQAKRGKKAFLEWYNSADGKRCRSVGDLDITVLQSICDDADKELQALVDGQGGKDQDAPEDDIPF